MRLDDLEKQADLAIEKIFPDELVSQIISLRLLARLICAIIVVQSKWSGTPESLRQCLEESGRKKIEEVMAKFDDDVNILFHWFDVFSHAVNRVGIMLNGVKWAIKMKRTKSYRKRGKMRLQDSKRFKQVYSQIIHMSTPFNKPTGHWCVAVSKHYVSLLSVIHPVREQSSNCTKGGQ